MKIGAALALSIVAGCASEPQIDRALPQIHPAPARVQTLVRSSDGSRYAGVDGNGGVTYWSAADGASMATINDGGPSTVAALSPNGELIALGGREGRVSLWRLPAARRATEAPQELWHSAGPPIAGEVRGVAISPDGRWVVATESAGRLNVFDASSGNLRRILRESGNGLGMPLFTPDGRMLITAGQQLRFWDLSKMELEAGRSDSPTADADELQQREVRARRFPPLGSWATCVAMSADGRVIAAAGAFTRETGGHPTMLAIVDSSTGSITRQVTLGPSDLQGLAISDDGALLAIASDDGAIRLMSLADGSIRPFLPPDGAGTRPLIFARGGYALQVGGPPPPARSTGASP